MRSRKIFYEIFAKSVRVYGAFRAKRGSVLKQFISHFLIFVFGEKKNCLSVKMKVFVPIGDIDENIVVFFVLAMSCGCT